MSIVRKMTVNCELLQISEMTKLPKVRKNDQFENLYISIHEEARKMQIWGAGKPHSKLSIG